MSRVLALATLATLSLLTASTAHAQATAKPSMPAATVPAKPAAAKPAASAAQARLDLNTATRDELAALPGIGDTLAAAIIQHRPYRQANDLVSKKVIPEAAYQKIRSKVVAHHA